MTDLPLISVIVPVYGVEVYLDQCVQSIVDQTYQNLEILLVDDGSPDHCGAMCDAWAEKDSRIRVIHQVNAGAGAARNAALDIARGELVGMVDSDDYISNHMYMYLYSLMENDVDIAECQIGITESDDFLMDDPEEAKILSADANLAMKYHIRDEMFCQTPPNKLYRRSAIGSIRFPAGNLIDDEFFTYRVIGNARKLVHSSAKLYAYRQQAASAMHRPFSLRRLQGLDAKTERLAYLSKKMPQLEQEAKFDLFFYCIYLMQESLRWLRGEELSQAKLKIKEVVASIKPVCAISEASVLKRVLLRFAHIHFEGTCRILNFLIAIHVLN